MKELDMIVLRDVGLANGYGIHESRLSAILRNKPFPVVDLINWTDKEKDEAVIAYLQDMRLSGFAATYKMSGTSDKNRHYQNFESAIRDLIDQFNEVNL